MDNVTKTKFILVLIIGFILIGLIFISIFGGKKELSDYDSFEESDYSDMEKAYIDTEQESNIDLGTDDLVSEKVEMNGDEFEEAPDYMYVYMDRFGVLSTEEAMETAKEIVSLFLEENDDKTMWESYTTPSFFNSYFNDFSPSSDGLVRIIYQIKAHAAEPMNENEMRFGVFVQWNLSDGEHTISQQSKLYYVTLELFETSWQVKELVEL